jgi:hypothetical protein
MKLWILMLLWPWHAALSGKACSVDLPKIQQDIQQQAKSLFLLDDNTEIKFVPKIDETPIPSGSNLALFEFVTEDRIYAADDPRKQRCPGSRIRIYRVRTQDPGRICSGIMRLQIPAGIADVVHLNCGN